MNDDMTHRNGRCAAPTGTNELRDERQISCLHVQTHTFQQSTRAAECLSCMEINVTYAGNGEHPWCCWLPGADRAEAHYGFRL